MSDPSIEITLDDAEYTVPRARLGMYLSLETLQADLMDAAKREDSGAMSDSLFRYFSVATSGELKLDVFHKAAWYEILNAFISIATMNLIDGEFAILQYARSDLLPVPWNHPERLRISWIHILAKAYNWVKKDIENLWIEEAIGFIQEIEADEQAQRDFIHSLSEVAYPYSEATKKNKYVPLQKPLWMVHRDVEEVMTKLDRRILPIGVIHHADGTESEYEAVP